MSPPPPPPSPRPPPPPAAAVHPVCDGCGAGHAPGGWRAGADGMQLCPACWACGLAGSGR